MRLDRPERILDTAAATVAAVNGRFVRDMQTGAHKRLVAYVPATASTADVVRELRAAAEALARTLPRVAS